jgi:hypothetical protein
MKASMRNAFAVAVVLEMFGMSATAAEITLHANVTTVPYFQPNVGASFAELVQPDAFFNFEGVRYDSFTFSPFGSSPAPTVDELWLIFNPFSQSPMVVVDPSILGDGAFEVGWTVTAPTSHQFSRVSLVGADFSSGTGDVGPAGTRVVGNVFGDSGFLGTQAIQLASGGCDPCLEFTNLVLDFAPQTQLTRTFQVSVTGDARFTAFGATTQLSAVPVPEPSALVLVGAGVAGWLMRTGGNARRRARREEG